MLASMFHAASPGTGRRARAFVPTLAGVWLEPRRLLSLGPNWSRAEAVRFYRDVFEPTGAAVPQWDGNVDAGVAGALGDDYRKAILARVNAYRTMAGAPAIGAIDPTMSYYSQQAALMMSANGRLSHTPDPSWKFYSADGAIGAARSNLHLASGDYAVDGYILDPGPTNGPTGHRWWSLNPRVAMIGVGDVPGSLSQDRAANALSFGLGTSAVESTVVAWPPEGAFPSALVPDRWSFIDYADEQRFDDSGIHYKYDYTSAVVRVTSNGEPQAVVVEYSRGVFGNYLVFSGIQLPGLAMNADVAVDVTIDDVLVWGVPQSIHYTTRIFSTEGLEPVYADFGSDGLWRFSEAEGSSRITEADPDAFVASRDGTLYIDFGAFGLWSWGDLQGVRKLNDADPESMAAGSDGSLFVDYGAYGLWRVAADSGFHLLSGADPESMEAGPYDSIYVDYGSYGTWAWKGATGFRNLTAANPEQLAIEPDGSLDVDFGPYGVWNWREGGGFVFLDASNPESMAVGANGSLYLDLGPAGLWQWIRVGGPRSAQGSLQPLHPADPTSVVAQPSFSVRLAWSEQALYISYGAFGLWRWKPGALGGAFRLVDARSPQGVVTR
ncbi:CAP domain-containing protein [Paludisphaera mucosa]|uniref:CAP domain-containing protein n=1 Tax=Paludisphaera mucosa TaxID=3030827 RepID=A0ABT6FKA2_9BACT|nr:CAP domain-containing protein [Paludisphaera mucosa]MDG3007984.1 CAP domain-containing protein [Paludisphaera mucosa]